MATAPLYGDPTTNALSWSKWAVLLGSTAATIPTGKPTGGVIASRGFTLNDPTVPTTTQWDPIGALEEDNPFGDGEESFDETDLTAAGFGVYGKVFRHQQETVEFTALEKTLITVGLLYDASGITSTTGVVMTGKLKQRDPTKKYLIGFVRENATQFERRTSQNYAQINSITRNNDGSRETYTVSVAIYPDSSKQLYDYYLGVFS